MKGRVSPHPMISATPNELWLKTHRKIQCPSCHKETVANYRREMLDEDEADLDDATEGQQADYFAASASGDVDEWGVDKYEGICEHCKKPFCYEVV
jgi:hypothetical protein